MNQQSLRPVRRPVASQSGGRLFSFFHKFWLSSVSLSGCLGFLAASASLCSGCVWFGLVRLKRADGSVRIILFFYSSWLLVGGFSCFVGEAYLRLVLMGFGVLGLMNPVQVHLK